MSEKIYKSFPAIVTKVDNDLGIVEAIVSVMGHVDYGDDRIHNGAFIKTINERGNKVRVLNNHNMDTVLSVVGKPLELRELSKSELPQDLLAKYPDATGGLYTRTQYLIDTPEGLGVFKRIKQGAIDEYSIGFQIPKGKSDYTVETINGVQKTIRNIREISLMEFSSVIFGMNDATTTINAKNLDEIKKVSLMETFWNVTDAFNSQYCMRDEDHNYFGYMATDVFDNNSMLCRAINIESDYTYYQLNYFADTDNGYRFDETSDWIGGNYTFMAGVKSVGEGILLEDKAGRVISQSNMDKLKECHSMMDSAINMISDVMKSAMPMNENMPDDEDMPMMDDKNIVDLAKPDDDSPLTNKRDDGLKDLEKLFNYFDNIGVNNHA